jgi:imidazolonepropionase-like amidohydrolase
MTKLLLFTLSMTLVFAQDRPLVLKTSTLFDGKGKTLKNTIIVIQGSKIASVGGKAPANAVTYDLTAFTVSPGWIDTHTHIANHFNSSDRFVEGEAAPVPEALLRMAENLAATLNAGFTTLQSPGAMIDNDLRDAVARGILPGPRVRTSLDALDEHSGGPDQMRTLIRERKQQGADFIKIFASKSIREDGAKSLTDEQIQAACGEAKALGLRTLVHAHTDDAANAAVLAGCTAIEHGFFVSDATFDLMAQHGTYYDPQIGLLLQNYLENKAKYLGIGTWNEHAYENYVKYQPVILETFKRSLKHKNLKIVYGTDANAGAHGRNYQEFIGRVRDGGQDPMQVLIGATALAAESMGMGDQIGSIAPGMQADIVAFDGNPLQDVNAAGRAVFVMKAGKVFENLGHGAKDHQ